MLSSDSIITRSRSIHPFRAAASIIAYSPETWYAASGRFKPVTRRRNHIEIRHCRLHHDHVCAFLDVRLNLAHGLAYVRPVHLIRSPVSKLRRRIRRLAEWTIKSRSKFRRIRKNRRIANPASSRALRIAATRPSIMSEGAMMSMPAFASETEVRASNSSEASFTISYSVVAAGGAATAAPSDCGAAFTIPQCPCDMYSQRQTSPIKISFGHFALDRPRRLLHDAVLVPRPGRDLIFLVGQSKQNHRRHAQPVHFLRFLHRLIHRQVAHPGHRLHFLPHALPGTNKHGIDKCIGRQPGLSYQVAKLSRSTKSSQARHRKCHRDSPGKLGQAYAFPLQILDHCHPRSAYRRCQVGMAHVGTDPIGPSREGEAERLGLADFLYSQVRTGMTKVTVLLPAVLRLPA